jgi:hypothetical protein
MAFEKLRLPVWIVFTNGLPAHGICNQERFLVVFTTEENASSFRDGFTPIADVKTMGEAPFIHLLKWVEARGVKYIGLNPGSQPTGIDLASVAQLLSNLQAGLN